VGLNYTAWATNWIDPEHVTVRLLMLGLMLISLVMSAAIPRPSAIAPGLRAGVLATITTRLPADVTWARR
jgi:hypothetical protein